MEVRMMPAGGPAKLDEVKAAEDLKSGDVFLFRGEPYLCLLSFTDGRHSMTVVTALPFDGKPATRVVGVRFVRRFRLAVVGSVPTNLSVLDMTEDEVLNGCIPPAAGDQAAGHVRA